MEECKIAGLFYVCMFVCLYACARFGFPTKKCIDQMRDKFQA